jgi:hypothetical protein
MPADCPICLEAMVASEEIFSLPCQCGYNFCSRCVETFVRSSKDDYAEASDGSRQVKVHVMCPQCRGKYPMNISRVLVLRKAHTLGTSIVDDSGTLIPDSALPSSQLALKRDFFSGSKKRQLDRALGLYMQVMEGSISNEVAEDADKIWSRLFEGIPDLESSESKGSQSDDNDSGDEHENTSSHAHRFQVDDTLFQGLEDFMGHDEKVYLTQLLTSGEPNKLAQAAMILNGVLRLSTTRASILSNLCFDQNTKRADVIEKTKVSFPLPNHMPGYFLLPTFNRQQKYMMFEDMEWDGSIMPPARSRRVFEHIYGEHYQRPAEPRSIVIVKGVKGPAGRVGLRKEDAVTHLNDMEWTGNAQELKEHIYELYERNQEDEISLTVNAAPETATFLRVRHEMMKKAHNELI